MIEIGVLTLRLALLGAVYAVVAGLVGAWARRPPLVRSSRHAAYTVHVLVVAAALVLWRALILRDFSLEYVASYSSSTLSLPYTIAALWGGQAGSLLFWVLILTCMSTVVHLQNRERNARAHAVRHGDADGDLGLLPGAPGVRDRPVRAPAGAGARGRRPEPAPAELLDDDPSAVALPRLRGVLGAVRVRDRGARDRAARRRLDPHHPALDAVRVVLPLARQHARRALGVRGARLGRLLGVGPGRERGLHAVARRAPPSCTR